MATVAKVPHIPRYIYLKATEIVLAAEAANPPEPRRAPRSKPARPALPAPRAQPAQIEHPKAPEHGQHIYVFHHLQKNHVVYSLDKSMHNNAALRQLPFNGKKTVPAALRKDLWAPLAIIKFPPSTGPTGLLAFQKLREYRRRHELEWNENSIRHDEIKYPEEELTPEELAARREENFRRTREEERERNRIRARKICDQKANSVADIAAVLARLTRSGMAQEEKAPIGLKKPSKKSVRVKVLWTDICDAEYAKTWTGNVEHMSIEEDAVAKKAARAQEVAARAEEAAAAKAAREAERNGRLEPAKANKPARKPTPERLRKLKIKEEALRLLKEQAKEQAEKKLAA